MKTRMNSADDLFNHILKNDRQAGMPNRAVGERLNYHFMLKHSSRKVFSNSFSLFGSSFFFFKTVGLKAGLATVCLVGLLFFMKLNNSQSISVTIDSCQVNHALADSNFVVKDTCR